MNIYAGATTYYLKKKRSYAIKWWSHCGGKQIISSRALLRAIPCYANFSTYTAAVVMARHKSLQHDSLPFLRFSVQAAPMVSCKCLRGALEPSASQCVNCWKQHLWHLLHYIVSGWEQSRDCCAKSVARRVTTNTGLKTSVWNTNTVTNLNTWYWPGVINPSILPNVIQKKYQL